MVWYSHFFKNFPQLVVIHTVKDFSVVNEAEVDVFLKFSYFFDNPTDLVSLISGFLCLFKIQPEHLEVLGSCTVEEFSRGCLENFGHYFASM